MNTTPSPRHTCHFKHYGEEARFEIICEATACCVARIGISSGLSGPKRTAKRAMAFFESIADGDVELNFQAIFQAQLQIADIWSVADVQEIRPDLSDAQAWEVLRISQAEYDANCGINWDRLSDVAWDLFGQEPEVNDQEDDDEDD